MEKTPALTRDQAAIVGAYTGYLCGPVNDLKMYLSELAGRPVYTHEMADADFMNELKVKAKPDFVALAASKENA